MNKFFCKICGYKTKTESAMIKHVKQTHPYLLKTAQGTKSQNYGKHITKESIIGYLISIGILFFIIWIFRAPSINNIWVSSFVQNINNYRINRNISPLIYCQTLDNYAQTRFKALSANYNISEYNGNNLTTEAEDVFYPKSHSASDFYNNILLPAASTHVCILGYEGWCTNNTYYGYYIGNGTTYSINHNCPNATIGTYLPIFYSQNNCNPTIENTTYLVMELSTSCS